MGFDVKLGTGRATGMFYTAPNNTPLPTDLSQELPEAWVSAGDVTDAGITLSMSKTITNLRNWANMVKRAIQTEHVETIQTPLMDTTEASLKIIVGERNVAAVAANAQHGKVVTANFSDGDLPEARAFLWIMKDGDDLIALGTKSGQSTTLENVTFSPGNGITWTTTITNLDELKLIWDDGQKTA